MVDDEKHNLSISIFIQELKEASPEQLAEIRRLLGVGDFYRKTETTTSARSQTFGE